MRWFAQLLESSSVLRKSGVNFASALLFTLLSGVLSQAQTVVFQPSAAQGNAVDFGSAAVGTMGQTQTLTFRFLTSNGQAIQAPQVYTGGTPRLDFQDAGTGTCSVGAANGYAFPAGSLCTVDVAFSPTSSGTRGGAVSLVAGNGVVVATAYVRGVGIAPQFAFYGPLLFTVAPPPIITAPFTSTFLAVDEGKNLYAVVSGTVAKFVPSASGTYTQQFVSNAPNSVGGLAVDSTGSVFVGDIAGQRVLKESPVVNGGFTESVVVTGLTPAFISIDGSGNLYVADDTAHTVVKESLTAGVYVQSPFLSDLGPISSLTASAAGNVYVADEFHSLVKYNDSGQALGTVPGVAAYGPAHPVPVAVDANDDLFVVSGGTQRYSSLDATFSSPITVASNDNEYAIAIDSSGTLYSLNATVIAKSIFGPQPIIGQFGLDAVTDGYVVNNGNAPLNFAVNSDGSNSPLPFDFTIDSSSSCPGYAASPVPPALTQGATCLLAFDQIPGIPNGSGPNSVTFTDNNLNVAGAKQPVLVLPEPQVLPVSDLLPPGTVNIPYSFQFSLSQGGVGPFQYDITGYNVPFPPGLVASSSGTISGTPLVAGTYLIAVRAIDPSRFIAQLAGYQLVVNTVVLSLSPSGLPNAKQGVPYSQLITAQGGTGPYTFAVTSGVLPPGMTLTPAGLLSGTPVPSGPFPFTITATDSSPAPGPYSGSASYVLTVTAKSSGPIVNASKGFTDALGLHLNGTAAITDKKLVLTDGQYFQAASAWSNIPVPIEKFTTGFDFQFLKAEADGLTFTVQNAGPAALGYLGGDLGYGGIPASVAVKFDLFNNAGEQANSTGFFINGAMPTFPSSVLENHLNLKSGHVFHAHVAYDGISLKLKLTDTVTNESSTFSEVLNLPSLIGATDAYVGFTAGTGALTSTTQILNWTYTTP